MLVKIKNNKPDGYFSQSFIDNNIDKIINGQLVSEWELSNILPNSEIIEAIWNGSEWTEGATPEEILQANAIKIPTQISRMKFIIQVFLTTGIMYEDIVLFVQNLNFDEAQKYVILTRLKSATHFDRNSNDLLTISAMMGITSNQLDEIFINGNLIE